MAKANKKTVEETPADMGKNLATMPAGPGAPMEIVFSFDTTGSMSGCIAEVRKNLSEIIDRLLADIPALRVAVFAHVFAQYCDRTTYITKFVDFTNDAKTLKKFINTVRSTGGGDWEECYELVFRQAWRDLSWAPGSQRAFVMTGDAIPHEPTYQRNNIRWENEVKKLYDDMGVRIYAVQCQNNDRITKLYKHLANKTKGKHLILSEFPSIVNMLLAICYRETGAEYFENYEKEVRAMRGAAIPKDVDFMLVNLRNRADMSVPSTTAGPFGVTSVPDTDDDDAAEDSGIGLDDEKEEVKTTSSSAKKRKLVTKKATVKRATTSKSPLNKRKRKFVEDAETPVAKCPSLSATPTRPRVVGRQARSKHMMKLRNKRLLRTVHRNVPKSS